MIEFRVTMPPSTNNLFVNVKGRGRVTSKRYQAWQQENLWALKAMRLGSFAGPVRVDYILPAGSRMDCDNACKPLGDLLQKSGILANDRQIRQLWVDHQERPGVLVRVWALLPLTKTPKAAETAVEAAHGDVAA